MKIRAEKVSKEYLRKTRTGNVFYAVEKADLELEPGKLTVLTGRSGSGKSTLLNMMAGLLQPTEGQVFLGDTDLYRLDDKALSKLRSKEIGVIPQGQTALYALTVLENVLLSWTLYPDGADHEAEAMELLEKVGIGHLASSMASELSGGEMRRMAIARAMIRKPSVILADEPTGDLDDENTQEVLKLLKETAGQGTAVLLVTHEKEAERYADILMKMDSGRLSVISICENNLPEQNCF